MPSETPQAKKAQANAGPEEKDVSVVEALREQQSFHEQRINERLNGHEQRIEALVLQMLDVMEGRTHNSNFCSGVQFNMPPQPPQPGLSNGVPAPTSDSPQNGSEENENSAPEGSSKVKKVKLPVRAAATLSSKASGATSGSESADTQLFRAGQSSESLGDKMSMTPQKSIHRTKTKDMSQNNIRRLAQNLLNQNRFDYLVAVMIITNACCIGAHADWAIQHIDQEEPPVYRGLDLFFLIFFASELVLRVIGEGEFFLKWYNRNFTWNILDSLVVLSAIAEEIFLLLSGSLPTMQAVRLLRILRLVRIVRVLRVLRFLSDLRQMVYGILSTLKSLIWCLLLLVLVQFMFAVCIMQIITIDFAEPGVDEGYQALIMSYFGSMIQSLYTLDKSIFGGLDWGDAADPLSNMSPFLTVFFVLYISFAMLCVLNVITGVFVENANRITMMDEETMIMHEVATRNTWMSEVRRLFEGFDADGSGSVTWEEFSQVCRDLQAQSLMRKLGIAVEEAATKSLFDLLDFDGDGTVDIEEFILGVQRIHGHARSIDIVKIKYQNKMMLKKLDECKQFWESKFPSHRPQNICAQQYIVSRPSPADTNRLPSNSMNGPSSSSQPPSTTGKQDDGPPREADGLRNQAASAMWSSLEDGDLEGHLRDIVDMGDERKEMNTDDVAFEDVPSEALSSTAVGSCTFRRKKRGAKKGKGGKSAKQDDDDVAAMSTSTSSPSKLEISGSMDASEPIMEEDDDTGHLDTGNFLSAYK